MTFKHLITITILSLGITQTTRGASDEPIDARTALLRQVAALEARIVEAATRKNIANARTVAALEELKAAEEEVKRYKDAIRDDPRRKGRSASRLLAATSARITADAPAAGAGAAAEAETDEKS